MPLVFILGIINALLVYRDSSNPDRLGRALIKPKINTLCIICIILQLKHTCYLIGQVVITKQIMPEVIILGCIYALPAYRDLMRAEGPKDIPIY